MPLIEDLIDQLASAKVFSMLDLKNGFFHVPVAEECRKFTSFVTPDRQYEFNKTPFGLSVSSSYFLKYVATAFQDLIREKVVMYYMDDIIIPAKSEEEAFLKLKRTLAVAAQSGIIINWKKCQFMQSKIDFLGYRIENGAIRPSELKEL